MGYSSQEKGIPFSPFCSVAKSGQARSGSKPPCLVLGSSPQAIVSFLAVKIYPPFLSRCAMFPFLRRGGAYVAEILPGTEPWLSEKAELYEIKDGFCKMRLRLGGRNSDMDGGQFNAAARSNPVKQGKPTSCKKGFLLPCFLLGE